MKTYIYSLLIALALASVPAAYAGQSPDPALEAAHIALEKALICVPPPYYIVECLTFPGGTAEVRFHKVNFGEINAQAIQDGSAAREWIVQANLFFSSCTEWENSDSFADDGTFTSKGQGFHPWKSDILDFCAACVNNSDCLSLLP